MELPRTQQAQLTALLPNDLLSRLERMRLTPARRFTNRSRGEHLSGRGGNSTEFSDYRDYSPGDDVRFVDWNIFSRLHRPYLKLFRLEEEMHVVILVDASASMQFEGKLDKAKQLAAAFAVMGLMAIERTSVYAFNSVSSAPNYLPPCTGRASMRRAFEFIESIQSGGDEPPDKAIEALLARHRGRGVVVLLSDLLTFGDLGRSFNLLFSAGLEIFALQVLAPQELDPQLTGDMRLVDSESNQTLDITSAGDLLPLYHEYREAYQEHLELLAKQRGGRYLCVSSQESPYYVLIDLLRRKVWVR